jgi:hypothetical protein
MTSNNQKSEKNQREGKFSLRGELVFALKSISFAILNGVVTLLVFLWFFSTAGALKFPFI